MSSSVVGPQPSQNSARRHTFDASGDAANFGGNVGAESEIVAAVAQSIVAESQLAELAPHDSRATGIQ